MIRAMFTGIFTIALFSLGTTADAALIDFEGFADDTPITNQFSGLGVIFDQPAYIENEINSRGSIPNWLKGESGPVFDSSQPSPISGRFLGTTDSVSALVVYADSATTTTLDVFDSNGLLIGTNSIVDDGVISVNVAGIASFRFSYVLPGGMDDVIGIDDFRFNDVNAVPEPASMVIWASLSGMGLLLVRRQRQS